MIDGIGRETTPPPLVLRALARADRALTALGRLVRRMSKRLRGQPLEILVAVGWRLGDEVMALPVFAAVRAAHPTARIVARVRYPELLAGNPAVDAVNPPALFPDLVLELRGEVAGEARRKTLARKSGVRLDGLEPRVHLSESERSEPALPELAGLAHGRPRVAVHASATQPCKQWGRAAWTAVAERLARAGASVIEVGLEGPPLGVGLDLLGKTDVRRLARVLAQVDLVIGDDSGPIHLALAVGTPALAVFGPTTASLLYPDTRRFVAVESRADCVGCWTRRTLAYPGGVCPLERHRCMEEVSVERVVERARALLALGQEVHA